MRKTHTMPVNISDADRALTTLCTLSTGLSEWEDAGIVAQVLAASQQEYLDNLKKAHDANHTYQKPDDYGFGGPSTSS